MKSIHNESYSIPKKPVTPLYITEVTPKTTASPRKLVGDEIECIINAHHKPTIHINKCPHLLIPALDAMHISEETTVTLSDYGPHSRVHKKRRQ